MKPKHKDGAFVLPEYRGWEGIRDLLKDWGPDEQRKLFPLRAKDPHVAFIADTHLLLDRMNTALSYSRFYQSGFHVAVLAALKVIAQGPKECAEGDKQALYLEVCRDHIERWKEKDRVADDMHIVFGLEDFCEAAAPLHVAFAQNLSAELYRQAFVVPDRRRVDVSLVAARLSIACRAWTSVHADGASRETRLAGTLRAAAARFKKERELTMLQLSQQVTPKWVLEQQAKNLEIADAKKHEASKSRKRKSAPAKRSGRSTPRT